MVYKVATTASTCSLATVAWRVNINLLHISSSWWKPSSAGFPVVTRPELPTAGRLAPPPEHLLHGPWRQRCSANAARWGFAFKSSVTPYVPRPQRRFYPWQSTWQTKKHSPRVNVAVPRSGGSLRRRCGWCERPRRSPRSSSFPPSAASLDERTPPCGISTLQWCWAGDRGTWLAGLGGTRRFAKQKDERQGGR